MPAPSSRRSPLGRFGAQALQLGALGLVVGSDVRLPLGTVGGIGLHLLRLPDALASLGFGEWTLSNVYSFVYDASMELPVDDGRELARRIDETDYAASLLGALDAEG